MADTALVEEVSATPAAEEAPKETAEEPTRLYDLMNDEDAPETPEGEAAPSEEDEFEDFEWEGKKFKTPKGFQKEFTDGTLRQSDYTRKSQSNAEIRKELQAREQRIAEQARAVSAELETRAELTAVRKQLSQYANIDWQSWYAQDQAAAQAASFEYNQLEREAQRLTQQVDQSVAKRVEESQRGRQTDLAKRLHETTEFARTSIKDWKPETDKEVVDFALAQGVDFGDLQAAMNPTIYKILYFARKGYEVLNTPAKPAAQLQQQQNPVTPVKRVGGKAASPARRPEDIADMETYVATRKKQMAARAAR